MWFDGETAIYIYLYSVKRSKVVYCKFAIASFWERWETSFGFSWEGGQREASICPQERDGEEF